MSANISILDNDKVYIMRQPFTNLKIIDYLDKINLPISIKKENLIKDSIKKLKELVEERQIMVQLYGHKTHESF
jgi:hypothetical protein